MNGNVGGFHSFTLGESQWSLKWYSMFHTKWKYQYIEAKGRDGWTDGITSKCPIYLFRIGYAIGTVPVQHHKHCLYVHCLLQQQHPPTVHLVINMNNTKSQLFTILPITMISINM
jgi:hypothetical protein